MIMPSSGLNLFHTVGSSCRSTHMYISISWNHKFAAAKQTVVSKKGVCIVLNLADEGSVPL